MKTKKKTKTKAYKPKKAVIYRQQPEMLLGELSGLKGQFKPNLVPEIKVSFNKGKRILGKITSSHDVADFIRKQYKRGTIETQEYFNILYLNKQNNIIGYYRHSKGGIDGTLADMRIIFGVALKSLATALVLSHNHPSGNLKPSQADITLTKKCKQLAELHNIAVLDHVIITKAGYLSFVDEGLL